MADKIVDEGLAEYFQLQKYPGFTLRGKDLSSLEIDNMCKQTKKMLWVKMGTGKLREWLKKYDDAIYIVGYEWISKYAEGRVLSMYDLLSVPTNEVLEFLKIKRPLLQRLIHRNP